MLKLRIPKNVFRYATIGVFGFLFVLVLCTFRDYGVTWDEELQSQYGIAVVDYYLSGFKDARYSQIFNLYLYGGTFDGLAALINFMTPFEIYDTRHLLNALFGLMGLWGTWKLGKLLGGEEIGFLSLVICALVPSFYGHIFNNPKDVPFAAGIVWTLYYMSRSYKKTEWPTLIKLGLVLGFTLGVRVGGIMVFAYWLAPLGIAALLPLFKRKFRWKTFWKNKKILRTVTLDILCKAWRIVLPVALISYVVMLICWPWAQQHPIMYPLKALSKFSNFPQDVEVLFDGTIYRSTQLPWTYVPLYFGIQLPVFFQILLAFFAVFLPKIWRSMSFAQKQSLSLLLLTAVVPVLYCTMFHPALYDTVRHFLFVIPLASIMAALGAREIYIFGLKQKRLRKKRAKLALKGAFGFVFLIVCSTQIVLMARLHPYEYIYANMFAGGVREAYGHYESDYWTSSFKEAAEKLQAFVEKEGGVPAGKLYRVAICGARSSATIYLPPNFRPVIANEPAEFFLSTTRWMCQNMRPGKEIIRIERFGAPLSIVKDLRDGYAYYEGNRK
ncbi:MAG: glycosyltransferase family 39 protein [Bdellovibrionales bacterium]